MDAVLGRIFRIALWPAGFLMMLAGCFSGGSIPGEPPLPHTINVRFVPRRDADAILVTTVDRLPLRRAELITPEGERLPAEWIDVSSSPREAQVVGSNQDVRIPGEQVVLTQLGAMVSTASLRLPDSQRYAHSWRQWQVALHLGQPGGAEGQDVILPAPAPPPG